MTVPASSIWDANSINGNLVDDTDKADTNVLSYNADSGKIEWVAPSSVNLSSASLNNSNNGQTLGTGPSYYFVNIEEGYSITLPDAGSMGNRELTFVTTSAQYESAFVINGPIETGGSWSLNGYSSVKLLCDGSIWWVTSNYTS